MAKKKQAPVDPDTAGALEVVEMEKNKEQLKKMEQREKEGLIAQSYELAGQIKSAMMFSKFGDVSRLMWLKQVKEKQAYKAFGTWDNYCDYLGLDRRTVDENLKNLSTFGNQFLETVSNLSIGYRDLRRLRKLTHEGDFIVEAEYVTIGEEKLMLSPDNAEDLQAAIETLLESKNSKIEDQAATIRAKNKVLKDKEDLINRQAKDLAKFEGKAKEKGYTPEEDAFLTLVSEHRSIIDKLLLKVDPENFMPADPTSRMRAAYVEMLGFIRRSAQGLYDTGAGAYDDYPEDGWQPPSDDLSDIGPQMEA